jgi:hypothetical protein
MTEIREQIEALLSYVQSEFPDATIMDSRDQDRSGHAVSIKEGGTHLLLTATVDFLSGFTAAEVTARLREWKVADVLRGSGPPRRVIVTTEGPKLEAR